MTNISNGKEDHTGTVCHTDATMMEASTQDAFCNEMSNVEERAKEAGERFIQADGRIPSKVIGYLRYYGFECYQDNGDPDCWYCLYRITYDE